MLTFWLGTHLPTWLETAGVPLMVSRRRLAGRKTFPRASDSWVLDSGGFSELSIGGEWSIGAKEYAEEVRRYRDEIGRMVWAASQDWMCEPFVLEKTGLTVREHQRRTVDNYVELRNLASDLPFAPVLQGFAVGDYLRHYEDYERRGVDLSDAPIVGVGSVCRRQGTREVADIFEALAPLGLRLHGFGVKQGGLELSEHHLTSADSMAWSFAARRSDPLPGCVGHINCANCLRYALLWRERLLTESRIDT